MSVKRPKKYSKAMLLAWRRTERAYERLIKGGKMWPNYGNGCRLCNVIYGNKLCDECVLGPGDGACMNRMCSESWEAMLKARDYDLKHDAVITIAKRRLAALRHKAERNLRATGQLKT